MLIWSVGKFVRPSEMLVKAEITCILLLLFFVTCKVSLVNNILNCIFVLWK